MSDKPKHQRLSTLLKEQAQQAGNGMVSIGDLLDLMQARACGAMIFIFAAPNLIPMPIPGPSAIFGALLMFLSAQLMVGISRPWLPGWITRRSMSQENFAKIVKVIAPWLGRAESLLRPRFSIIVAPWFECVVGALCFVLSLVLFLPIPLGNMLPALALTVMSLGMLEKDGVAILLGVIASFVSFAVISSVLYAFVMAIIFLGQRTLGL